jgi:F0F1-type ATP synthase membrane subunit b/b'
MIPALAILAKPLTKWLLIGGAVVLLGGAVYVQTLRLENANARNAMLKRDVDEAVRANASLVDQVATERSALALARELAAEYRRHRDDAQDRADSLDKQIREAPRAPTSDQCRAACRADPGVWRSITDPAGGVR